MVDSVGLVIFFKILRGRSLDTLGAGVRLRSNQTGCFFFFQAEDGIRDHCVTGVQTCALPIWLLSAIKSIVTRLINIISGNWEAARHPDRQLESAGVEPGKRHAGRTSDIIP